MGYIDYSLEPQSDIAFIDMKSFYASVECVERNLHPLETSLCVMSRADNSAGLILASSPKFKEVFGKKNVGRSYDLPFNLKTRRFDYITAKRQGLPTDTDYRNFIEYWAQRTYFVPPRMGLYIQKNLEIQEILKHYAPKEEILPYSIDEGFIDLTRSINYFIPSQTLNRKQKLDVISANIQKAIKQETGIYSTIGMSNANPLLAKLALDNEAKKNSNMRANWSYSDVETKVWNIPKMTDFWGIGHRTEKRLNRLKIYTIHQLANANPDLLKKEFGVIGLQLWFHANGVDESNVLEPYRPKHKGIGNSQILPKNYYRQSDIELVLSEMAEQVAIRLRKIHKKTTVVGIYVGYAHEAQAQENINARMTIDATNLTKHLTQHVHYLFRKHYNGSAVRSIGIRYSGLIDDDYLIFSLFDDPIEIEKEEKIEKALTMIRQKYGFLSIQKATALLENSRIVARSKLIGGHSAGGLDGLK